MSRQQINVRLPDDLITTAKSRGSLTAVVEAALREHLYGKAEDSDERYEGLERRLSRLEEMANL